MPQQRQPNRKPGRATAVNRWPAQEVQVLRASLKREDALPPARAKQVDLARLVARRASGE